MLGTLFALLLAILAVIGGGLPNSAISTNLIGGVLGITGIALLLIAPITIIAAWVPLQKGEQNTTPRLMELFRTDVKVKWEALWLTLFAIATLALAVGIIPATVSSHGYFLPVWLVGLGISADVAWSLVHRVLNYFNPFSVVKMFTQRAKRSILSDRELDLCDWIDALSEVAIKAVERHSSSIAGLALDELKEVALLFLDASKSIAHADRDKQTEEAGIQDKVSYTMFFLYQRIDIIFYKAVKNRLEHTCSKIVTLLGKIAVGAAKYDMSLASAPLRFLGKCAKKAQEAGFEETVITASCVLMEVSKTILNEIDITYYQIKDPFFSIINSLEVLSKEEFRRDKSINLSLLMQPFKDLRALFQSEKMKNHQDTPVIVQNIDRVLGEYEALLIVMNTIPPIPQRKEETTPESPSA